MDSFEPTIATNSRALAKLPRRVQDLDILMAPAPQVRRSRNLAGNLYKRCELCDEQLPHLSMRLVQKLVNNTSKLCPTPLKYLDYLFTPPPRLFSTPFHKTCSPISEGIWGKTNPMVSNQRHTIAECLARSPKLARQQMNHLTLHL